MIYKPLYILIIIITFLSMGCKNEIELSMERGIQFYEWEKNEEAILEFKYVIQNLESKNKTLENEEIKLLSRAHYNLAVAYSRNKWYADAAVEARMAFDLFPTEENRRVMLLIQKKNTQTAAPNQAARETVSK